MKYEAEIRVFKSKFGDLENVRKTLGFSRRKMCQLLLIDPSAWSRWHSDQAGPPPHVYRALEWFLILEQKTELHPRVADLYLKGAPPKPADGPAFDPRQTDLLNLQIADLHARIENLRAYSWVAPVVSATLVAIGFWIWR